MNRRRRGGQRTRDDLREKWPACVTTRRQAIQARDDKATKLEGTRVSELDHLSRLHSSR